MKKILLASLFVLIFFVLGFWASRLYMAANTTTPEVGNQATQTYLGAHHMSESEPHNFWGSYRGDFELGDNLIVAKNIAVPPRGLVLDYPAADFHFYSIDLDQDGTEDYIVENKTELQTCFIKSDLSIKNCEKLNHFKSDGFAYQYFVSSGKNKTLLLFDLTGDETTNNFSLKTLNPKTWKLEKLMDVFPIIDSAESSRTGLYRGYPWDIRDISVKFDSKGKLQFLSTMDQSIKGALILFKGSASQGDSTGPYDHLRPKLKYQNLELLK